MKTYYTKNYISLSAKSQPLPWDLWKYANYFRDNNAYSWKIVAFPGRAWYNEPRDNGANYRRFVCQKSKN